MATRTAPTVNGTPNQKKVAFKFIDWTGEKRSNSVIVDTAVTDAAIEAAAAAAQLLSNASLYEITVAQVYTSAASPGQATEAVYEDVGSNMVVQYQNPTTQQSIRAYIPALVNGALVEGTENIDPTDTDVTGFVAAFLAMLPAGFGAVGARFTQRRDINQQVKL